MERIDQKLQRLKRKIEERERIVFHQHFSPDERLLYQELRKHQSAIITLLNRKIINQEHYDNIFPLCQRTSSKKFDTTLLHVLLRNFCGFQKPPTGWDKEPKSTDSSVFANLVRLKIGRNRISHLGEGEVNSKNYKKLYKYLKKPLLALGCDPSELHQLLPKPVRFKYTPAVPDFAFRGTELSVLHDAICQSQANPGLLAICVYAISGIGKTQLVKKYFDLNCQRFNHSIVWINAATMEETFLDLARSISIATKDENDDDKDLGIIIQEIHEYFFDDEILFVFDNFEVPEMDSEFEEKLVKFIPNGSKVCSVITSQIEIFDPRFFRIKLKPWSMLDAVAFINDTLKRTTTQEIRMIVDNIDCNTFAIRQFITYIEKTKTPMKDYLHLLKEQPESLSPQTKLYNSLNVTIDQLEKRDPIALDLLQLMVFLNGKEIKRGLFICGNGYQEGNLETRVSLIENIKKSKPINEALYALEKFCLVEIVQDSGNYLEDVISVHTLVQQTLKLFPRQDQSLNDVFNKVMTLLLEGNDDKTEDELVLSDFMFFKYCYKQLLHIYNSFPDFKDQYLMICSTRFERVMNIFHSQGRLRFAIDLLKGIKSRNIFQDNFQKLYELESCIGYCYYHRRKFVDAYRKFRRVKEKQKTLLGERHPDTLKSSLGYVICQCYLGFYSDGLIGSEKLHKEHLEVLGALHPQTLICKRVIALSKFLLGDKEASLRLYQEVLKGQIKNHGLKHPEVFITRSEIIVKEHDWSSGQLELQNLLYDEIKFHGSQHLQVAATHSNLATSFLHQAKFDDALHHAKSCMIIRAMEYDERHKDVSSARNLVTEIISKRSCRTSRRSRTTAKHCIIS